MRRPALKQLRRFFRMNSLAGGCLFVLYVSLFIFHGILITATQTTDKRYSYSTASVVLGTELLKLIISIVLYGCNHPIRNICRDIRKDYVVLGLYLIPAFLYCLYNNLAFINLAHFDPTSYYLLLQFRVVITGVLFQVIFKKWLSLVQWLSLVLLTFGCLLKQVQFDWTVAPSLNMNNFLNIRILFVLLQTCCSCFAGVYNEYLLKRKGTTADIYIQNIYMYLDSILFNFLALFVLDKDPFAAFSAECLSQLADYRVILIIIISAVVGIITSFFLMKFNSILKVFAGALELICSAIISYVLFKIPVLANTILSILIVSLAITLYTLYPVQKNGKQKSNGQNTTVGCQENKSTNPDDVLDVDTQSKLHTTIADLPNLGPM